MSTPAKKERSGIINQIRDTRYSLPLLEEYIEQLLIRSNKESSEEYEEYEEFLNESFGKIAHEIMQLWYMCHELDKMMTKEREQKS
jgi:hypothetical protein